jgi:hypothetical protein
MARRACGGRVLNAFWREACNASERMVQPERTIGSRPEAQVFE